MPAIQMTLLKHQIAQLSEAFSQPETYVRQLHGILDFYTDRTLRPPRTGGQSMLMPHYSPPIQVMRQIQVDLAQHCAADPASALILADRLWMDSHLEPRLLAVFLLGKIPLDFLDPVFQRLQVWAVPTTERHLIEMLLVIGSTRLQKEKPDRWIGLLSAWLARDELSYRAMSLKAFHSLVEDPSFENLPLIYQALTPLVTAPPPALIPELSWVIAALAQRSLGETVYFLRHAISITEDEGTARLVRRCLPGFDPETQVRLRAALREKAENA